MLTDTAVENYYSAFPTESQLRDIFGKALVINKPMSGVGGDGYWVTRRNDLCYLVAFDCMGHGHFATMMTRFYLRAIRDGIEKRNITDPSKLLSYIHSVVEDEFADKDNRQIGTGADVGVLIYDRKNHQLIFSGAKMDLVEVRNGSVSRIKANRRSLGEYFGITRDYKNTELDVKKLSNTNFYLYSDGVTDLFGGPRDKKLGFKNLSYMLEESYRLNFQDAKEYLERKLSYWSGSNEALDDLLLVGINIKS